MLIARSLVLMVVLVGSAAAQRPQMRVAPMDVAQLGGPQVARSGVFRCELNERTVYQAEPCNDPATQSELGRGSFTVVDPYPVSPRPAGGKAAESTRRVGAASEDAEAAALKKKADCDYHQRAVERIDAQARMRSTARLAERRRGHKDSIWRLGCGFP